MIVVLKSIAPEQDNITETTAKSFTQMINYSATHYEAITRYHTSELILQIHRYASFLSDPGAKIRAGGYNDLSTASAYPKKAPPKQPPLNGPVNVKRKTTRNVLATTMEA